MPVTYTPLRYPGGKNALAGFLRDVIKVNNLRNPNYIEPYCGGAGAALNLLFSEVVSDIYLNDIDAAVYSFWRFTVTDPEEMCDRIASARLSVKEWERQKLRLRGPRPTRDLAFAALYLNRVNRSGILRAGLIGGRDQAGPWKMDARFNREDLIANVRRFGLLQHRIHVSHMDAVKFL
jgi:DNA adenine methylase